MSKNNYYAARYADDKKEIYEDWETCKMNILGKKGVRYKGFVTKKEALAFLEEGTAAQGSRPRSKAKAASSQKEKISTAVAIYVDGSYRDSIYSYGFVVVDVAEDRDLYRQKGRGVDSEAAKLRNVSGEMKGAMEAVNYCLQQGYEEVTICYDYYGIEKWALGTWKRNNVYTRKYHEFMQGKMDKLKIGFHKIKGHSGEKWNDVADMLAKEGLE